MTKLERLNLHTGQWEIEEFNDEYAQGILDHFPKRFRIPVPKRAGKVKIIDLTLPELKKVAEINKIPWQNNITLHGLQQKLMNHSIDLEKTVNVEELQ